MSRGGRRSTSFEPGVSGNPGGRPRRPSSLEARQVVVDAKALARRCAPEAIATLKAIMLSDRAPPAARIGAATALLDRGYGKAKQEVEVIVSDLSRLNDDELDALERLLEMAEASGGPAAH
jgi:type II secretory pathway predicted ATPase ExeA